LTLVVVMRVELRQIESGKTGIEMKVQLGIATGYVQNPARLPSNAHFFISF